MNKVQEDRQVFLKGLLDWAISNGWDAVAPHDGSGSICDYDINLIRPYANSLGLEPYLHYGLTESGRSSYFLRWTIRAAPKIKDPPKKDEILDEDKIYVTANDYERYKFCRDNWLCRLICRLNGK